jgi:hypothetical protein
VTRPIASSLFPPVAVEPVGRTQANALLLAWRHSLGPCQRPFATQSYVLHLDGQPVSLAVSASTASATAAGLSRRELVELARLCSGPGHAWATRVMLRIWREVCAPRWPYWPVTAAIAYSQNHRHQARIYRFDGWTKVTDRAGSSGGGTWSRRRDPSDPATGRKTLWLWRYPDPAALPAAV